MWLDVTQCEGGEGGEGGDGGVMAVKVAREKRKRASAIWFLGAIPCLAQCCCEHQSDYGQGCTSKGFVPDYSTAAALDSRIHF